MRAGTLGRWLTLMSVGMLLLMWAVWFARSDECHIPTDKGLEEESDVPREGYDAIIIAGGGQNVTAPPEHVKLRLDKAIEMYNEQDPKPFVITLGRGTWHKPCPLDERGFEYQEASMNARYLISKGVPAFHILEEHSSMETIGNAFFARIVHTDPLQLTSLAVVNNRWHMPRTHAVFDHVFSVPPLPTPEGYRLDYVAVADGMPPETVRLREQSELSKTFKYLPGGGWREATPTLRKLHLWMHMNNTAYAAAMQSPSPPPMDPRLVNTY